LNQCVDNVENLLLKLKERIIGSCISEVTAFLEDSPKCQFYKYIYIYSMHTLQYYLDRPVKMIFIFYRICIAITTESLISINVVQFLSFYV
jgi:hypothetical protein